MSKEKRAGYRNITTTFAGPVMFYYASSRSIVSFEDQWQDILIEDSFMEGEFYHYKMNKI